MFNPLKLIKRAIQAVAATILLLMLFFAVGGTWATAHPDSALARGFDAWEAEGDIASRAGRFVTAMIGSEHAEQQEQQARAEVDQDKIDAEQRRKAEENRRFNSGEMAGDSYNSGEMAGDSTNSEY